jgi:hypothetical protein
MEFRISLLIWSHPFIHSCLKERKIDLNNKIIRWGNFEIYGKVCRKLGLAGQGSRKLGKIGIRFNPLVLVVRPILFRLRPQFNDP